MLRSHVELGLFSLLVHLDAERIPERLRDLVSGSGALANFNDVIDSFFADDRLRHLLFHETYHFWQALRLPYLYFYGLESFHAFSQSLQFVQLLGKSELRRDIGVGGVLGARAISQKRLIRRHEDDYIIEWEDRLAPAGAEVAARLSCLDLMEGAATFCQWQAHQNIDLRADIQSFRRWCKRNPSYTVAFRFALDLIRDETLMMRCFVPLVCGAFHSSDPVRTFVLLLYVLEKWRSDPNFAATMSYPDPRPWSRMIPEFLSMVKFTDPPDSIRSLVDPPFCRLSMDFWLKTNLYHPFLTEPAVAWHQAANDAEKPDCFNYEAELIYQPAWVDHDTFNDALLRRGPRVCFLVLHRQDGTRRVMPFVDLAVARNLAQQLGWKPSAEPATPALDVSSRRLLLDLFGLYGAMRKAAGISFDPLHRFCYHEGCPEYKSNFCNLYFAVPEHYSQCGFPQLLQDIAKARGQLKNEEVQQNGAD